VKPLYAGQVVNNTAFSVEKRVLGVVLSENRTAFNGPERLQLMSGTSKICDMEV
jgi:hypothetical protein